MEVPSYGLPFTFAELLKFADRRLRSPNIEIITLGSIFNILLLVSFLGQFKYLSWKCRFSVTIYVRRASILSIQTGGAQNQDFPRFFVGEKRIDVFRRAISAWISGPLSLLINMIVSFMASHPSSVVGISLRKSYFQPTAPYLIVKFACSSVQHRKSLTQKAGGIH